MAKARKGIKPAVYCPKCRGEAVKAPGGFLEQGEWNGKAYENERDVAGYRCKNKKCGTTFFIG